MRKRKKKESRELYIRRCIFAQAFSYTFFGTVEIVIIYFVNGSVLRFEVVHCQANNAICLLNENGASL